MYLNRPPWLLQKWYAQGIWKSRDAGAIYLTFDDGPHPEITSFVLDELQKAGAKATFFCIGKNVQRNFEVYKRIISEGHSVGNHTHDHLNGWSTDNSVYLNNIAEAKKYIDSRLFRPPYGRITKFQLAQLSAPRFQLKSVMWSLLSGDFDVKLSPERCRDQLLLKVKGGDIVVFHDSEKAFDRLFVALPVFLQHCTHRGWRFGLIEELV